MTDESVKKKILLFPNGYKAVALFPSSQNQISEIITALDLSTYKAVMVISGGANNMDQKLVPALALLFENGIAKAAGKTGAIVIDGGTKAGVMEMMGMGVARGGYTSSLVGVAPAKKISLPEEGNLDKTALDPNHSCFVLVEGDDWGSETATLFDLAKALAKKVPAIAILAGGGKISKNEMLLAVRLKLYVIVVEGSGGLADEINAAWQNKPFLLEDPEMREIIENGDLHFYSLASSVEEMEREVIQALSRKQT